MVDVIPPPSDTEPPIMVLEAFEKSLWTARLRRPFSLGEIRSVMRSIAIGLSTIHHNNVVYTDLKMENVLVSGFNNETAGSGEHLVTKIADLGMVRPPSKGSISALTYRSPEYLHLLQAHAYFEEPGMFDSLKVEGTLTDKENTIRAVMAQEFDLHAIDYYNSDPDTRQLLPPKDETRTELDHWVVKLIDKDIPEKDLETVHVALNPVPELRPSALQLLEYGYI
ncbi:uncharacterized protein GIQ15_02199 [Arthroderma uncinatum]|uniref:uncharacterized protein n=1 Tax=Arthroderma uncinatum TaxID=74035 RepID=UPI00144A7B86|nr:uncharacterized protein GIQ15_02199 [Arthroderma uncinatum]KAF3482875.1 hypothetical protein GIQ15_02199 [Arthroderma uncinatum]